MSVSIESLSSRIGFSRRKDFLEEKIVTSTKMLNYILNYGLRKGLEKHSIESRKHSLLKFINLLT